MRTLLTMLISIIATSCYTKSTLSDLQQRSYFLLLLKDSRIVGLGTGFFVEKQNHLYLVSANHVFTGSDNDSIIPNKMAIFPIRSSKSLLNPIILDSIQKSHPFKPPNKFPDALAYKYQRIDNEEIYSIEKFIKKTIHPHINDSVFIWGYPSTSKDATLDVIKYTLFKEPSILYAGIIIGEDSIQLISSPSSDYGYSGSPAFLKRKNKYYFIGILFAGNKNMNRTYIVKYSTFKSEFE